MVETILIPCRVPWMISPSMSGVTLSHSETDVAPECTVTFGAGRLREDGRTDSRVVEIAFTQCYHARVGPHGDTEGIEAIGYVVEKSFAHRNADYLAWLVETWRETGLCPSPSFYVARRSAWLEVLPGRSRDGFRHYVVDGRDGYVELIARGFRWREWRWEAGSREEASSSGPAIGEGEGVA